MFSKTLLDKIFFDCNAGMVWYWLWLWNVGRHSYGLWLQGGASARTGMEKRHGYRWETIYEGAKSVLIVIDYIWAPVAIQGVI